MRPRIHPDVARLFGDRIVSEKVQEEISQLLHSHRNAAFSSGFRNGWNDALAKIQRYAEHHEYDSVEPEAGKK